jgi:hypothetical protein
MESRKGSITMKKVIISTPANHSKIYDALEAVQKRCSARTVSMFDIEHTIEVVERDREKFGISKKAMEGTTVYFHQMQKFASRYRGIPEATKFKLYFEKGYWKIDLDSICRDKCSGTSNGARDFTISWSEAAKAQIINWAS